MYDGVMSTAAEKKSWQAWVLEALLVLPALFAILTGVLDYGSYFGQQLAMNSAVAQAARTGSTTPQGDDPAGAAERTLSAALHAAGFRGAPKGTVQLVGRPPEQAIEVSIAVRYRAPLGLVPVPELVASRLAMRMEQQPDEHNPGARMLP